MTATFLRGALDKAHFPPDRVPFVVIAGRSNVGKSSVINALARMKNLARTSKTPGRTREINFFDFENRFFLVDLPGYGYAKGRQRDEWGRAIPDLFADDRVALVLLLIDIRREPTDHDWMLIELAEKNNLAIAIVLTKRDKIGRVEFSKIMSEWKKRTTMTPIVTSSETREGLDKMKSVIEERIRNG